LSDNEQTFVEDDIALIGQNEEEIPETLSFFVVIHSGSMCRKMVLMTFQDSSDAWVA
jgi:hypothetical protein